MTEKTASLLTLMSWLSPVFPTGGFAYSAGLEQAVADGSVSDSIPLEAWIAAVLTRGNGRNDSILLAEAHRQCADQQSIGAMDSLARALCLSTERLAETVNQGTSFYDAAAHWFDDGALPPRGTALPVIVGAAAGLAAIDSEETVAAYMHTFATNQLQCAIRLSVTGQNGAAEVLARLEPLIATTAAKAVQSTLDDLGTSAFLADISSMQHETLQPRLFLS